MSVQENPLVATYTELLLFNENAPEKARIEYVLLPGTESENTNWICQPCFKVATSMLAQYGRVSASPKVMVAQILDGNVGAVGVGRIEWESKNKCAYCVVATQRFSKRRRVL